MPMSLSLLRRLQPTPGSASICRSPSTALASSACMTDCPLGLARFVASLASSMLGPIPACEGDATTFEKGFLGGRCVGGGCGDNESCGCPCLPAFALQPVAASSNLYCLPYLRQYCCTSVLLPLQPRTLSTRTAGPRAQCPNSRSPAYLRWLCIQWQRVSPAVSAPPTAAPLQC